MIKCMGCMEDIEEGQEVCPICGYKQDTQVEEAYYLLPGTVIHGKYIVGRVLGYGGFGVTYIGWDAQLERKVAIKEYLPSSFSTRSYGTTQVSVFAGDKAEQFAKGMERFIKEAKRLAGVHQVPEIVQIYDCFMENDTGYIIMQYLEGKTLKQILKEKKKLSYEETKAIILPVLKGLSKVHELGIIHRDIAPDNIMITKKDGVKILDFGAARYAVSVQSQSLSVVLKPGYAPEEQYRSHGNQGPWTDVYAVGATMYRMLTGEVPEESIIRMSEDNLKTPSELGVELPQNVENALMNSLTVRAEERIQSADQLYGALAEGQEVDRIVVKQHKTAVEKEKMSKRMRLVVLGSGCLVVLIIALFATGVIRLPQQHLASSDGVEALTENESYIPDVCGLSYEEAENKLKKLGMEVVINGMNYSETIEKNMILSQDPVGGGKSKKGDTVSVVMSGGQEEVMMPDLVGMSKKKAKSLIEAQSLELGEVTTEYSDVVAKGKVISQSIDAEERIPLKTKVDLVVSKGNLLEETAELEVPDLRNKTQDEAKEILQSLKDSSGFTFKIGEVSHEYSSEVAAGAIISQSLEPGSTQRTDQEIEIVISDGAEQVVVPNVVYLERTEAVSQLESSGFKVTVSEQYSTQVAKGNVISQTVEGGTQAAKGSEVSIVVSLGKQTSATGGQTGTPSNNNSTTTTSPATSVPDNQPAQTPSDPAPAAPAPNASDNSNDDIGVIDDDNSNDDIGVIDDGDSGDDIGVIE